MGGFYCVLEGPPAPLEELQRSHAWPLDVFRKKRLPLASVVPGSRATVWVFGKLQAATENAWVQGPTDYIVATGALLYRRKFGAAALRALHADVLVRDWKAIFSDLCGNFGVVLEKKGELFAFNDFNGLYHVYAAENHRVLTSSFLAAGRAVSSPEVSPQELYEYIAEGAMYAGRTYLRQVSLLDSRSIEALAPARRTIPKEVRFGPVAADQSMETLVRSTADDLTDYFQALRENFGDSVASALSGGYDSRLMLCCMRKVGIQPFVYVKGKAESKDVRVSAAISRGENFDLYVHPPWEESLFPPEDSREIALRLLYFFDGQGSMGALGTAGKIAERVDQRDGRLLALNGGGGEIYRNFWQLPDRPLEAATFLRSWYDRVDWRVFNGAFDKRDYFETLTAKLKAVLGVNGSRLAREQIEEAYVRWRLQFWMGPNNKVNNQVRFAITPFAEPRFTRPSFGIPIRYKLAGRFEAALIQAIDPQLAAYPSAYGFSFAGPPRWKARWKAHAVTAVPCSMRPLLRRRLQGRHQQGARHFFLTPPYLSRLIDAGDLTLSNYLDVSSIGGGEMLNRAYTVELVLRELSIR